jgi:acid stress chaperone HdeA
MLTTSTTRKSIKETSMKLKRIATAVLAATLFASSTVAFAQSSSGKKAVEKMTCEDFVGLEDSFKPDAVYWAIAYGEDGKPDSAGVSVEGIQRHGSSHCRGMPKDTKAIFLAEGQGRIYKASVKAVIHPER